MFKDADIDAAVDGAVIAKFRNNGQTCVRANRIYVQSGAYDEFAESWLQKSKYYPLEMALMKASYSAP